MIKTTINKIFSKDLILNLGNIHRQTKIDHNDFSINRTSKPQPSR